MAVDVGLVVAAERHLPAHLGLPVGDRLAAPEGGGVQRAAGAAGEVGAVEEDAGAVDDPAHRLAVLVDVDRPPRFAAFLRELPLVLGSRSASLGLDVGAVVVVGEVGAVGAAALLELGGRLR